MIVGIFDLMGGKPSCNFKIGIQAEVCPTFTKGRAAVSDIHSIVVQDAIERNEWRLGDFEGSSPGE